jgi:hypothetical protein
MRAMFKCTFCNNEAKYHGLLMCYSYCGSPECQARADAMELALFGDMEHFEEEEGDD